MYNVPEYSKIFQNIPFCNFLCLVMLHGFKNGICCNYLESYSLGKCIKSFVLFSYMKSPVFYIQYQFTLLDCTKIVQEKSKIRKGKKSGRTLLAHRMSLWLYAR